MSELPTTFGKYFLTEKIAIGGMAEIYLAKLIGPGGFEKQLIIKQIHPELSGQPQFVDLFVTEAKTLVSLTHGNIVPIYELGVVEGTYFIAMEYIDGPTLELMNEAVRQRGESIDAAVAAYICAEFLKGLDYAHRKGDGVIHRDLSPRNVMISRDGEVKLVDFGIAVALEQQQVSEDRPLGNDANTRPEGSYPYMSPEQVRQQPLTGQSDLFSAGVLLWEMLAGKTLFARATAEETLSAVTEAPIETPSAASDRRGAEMPAELERISLRALERDRDKRFETAAEFLTEINRYLYSLETHVTGRTLSKMVATLCPPTVRRPASATDDSATEPQLDEVGDRTVPMARKGAPRVARAGGKTRASTKTFATNVHFENVLAKATPLFPIQAINDIPDPPDDTGEEIETSPDETASVPRSEPVATSRTGMIAIGLVGVLLALGVGIGVARHGGSSSSAPPPALADAGARLSPADAGPVDAHVAAGDPPDAAPPDARKRTVKRRTDAAPVARATSRLKVGANPWGEVYLDGRKLGRAPGEWVVPVGRHNVAVRFPVPGHEKTRSFKVNVVNGKTTSLGVVDFRGDQGL